MNQRERFANLVFYTLVLLLFNYLAFNQLLPLSNEKGIWFYSGVASILMGKLLTSPYYTTPANSISYSLLAIFAFIYFDISELNNTQLAIHKILILYFAIVILIGIIQILTKDNNDEQIQKISSSCYHLSELFGNQNVLFSFVTLFAILVYHQTTLEQVYPLLGWTTISIQPHKYLIEKLRIIKNIWAVKIFSKSIGKISSYQKPNLFTVLQNEENKIPFGSLIAFKDSFSNQGMALSLNYIGRVDGEYLRAVQIPQVEKLKFSKWKSLLELPINHVSIISENEQTIGAIAALKEEHQVASIIGLVHEKTSLSKLYFELINEIEIEVGQLLRVKINGEDVLYQVMDGLTNTDIVFQKNKYGRIIGEANVVGIWDDEEKKFRSPKWIPTPNSLVHLEKQTDSDISKERIGHFPKSNYDIRVDDINFLVTHNTAILGILGIGKSFLSMELVTRISEYGIKVICVDLTNEYADHLGNIHYNEKSAEFFDKLNEVGKSGKGKFNKNIEEGGSINEFKDLIKDYLAIFLEDSQDKNLLIINPSEYEVWRQSSNWFKDDPGMASLTPSEITAIISEAALELSQEKGMSKTARVCLVYEEAHALIPEWNSVVNDQDKEATNRTARAILQGRKYGMGCLLISQRTANVTKTILNQCNTIFAMRTFDDTGKKFLDNYVGSDYADMLPTLAERQAVFFGKASSCENPVRIRLNDRSDFIQAFYEGEGGQDS